MTKICTTCCKQTKKSLKEIKSQLPIGSGIPINLDTSRLSEILGLANISTVYLNSILMFVMKIPIIDNYELTLYKPIPLPIKLLKNLCTVIIPNSDYIALDKSRLFYVNLSAIQIAKCKHTVNQLICSHDQQIHHVGHFAKYLFLGNLVFYPILVLQNM